VIKVASTLVVVPLDGRLPSSARRSPDLFFWSDWVLSGAVALVGSALVGTMQGGRLSLLLLSLAFATLFFGCAALPFAIRVLAYDPASGKPGHSHCSCTNDDAGNESTQSARENPRPDAR